MARNVLSKVCEDMEETYIDFLFLMGFFCGLMASAVIISAVLLIIY